MYILAIDTTGKIESVALFDLDKKKVVLENRGEEERSHLKMLVPHIDELIKKKEIKKSEIKYVAVSIGPGSFTGIRIGVATARAIAQALNIKVIPVPTLDSFLVKEDGKEEKIKSAITFARRGQVYGFLYKDGKYILEPNMYMLNDILEKAKDLESVYFYGDGIDFYESELNDVRFSFAKDKYVNATDIANYAYLNLDKACSYLDVHPMYMKEAEAEEKLKKGELKIQKMRQD